jgi:hypothetical protein
MDVLLGVGLALLATPAWLGWGLGGALLFGAACTASFLVGNGRIGGDR